MNLDLNYLVHSSESSKARLNQSQSCSVQNFAGLFQYEYAFRLLVEVCLREKQVAAVSSEEHYY